MPSGLAHSSGAGVQSLTRPLCPRSEHLSISLSTHLQPRRSSSLGLGDTLGSARRSLRPLGIRQTDAGRACGRPPGRPPGSEPNPSREVQRASVYTHSDLPLSLPIFSICVSAVSCWSLMARRPGTGELGERERRSRYGPAKRSYGLYLWHYPAILSIYGMGPRLLFDLSLRYLPLRLVGFCDDFGPTLAAGSYRDRGSIQVKVTGSNNSGRRLRQRRARLTASGASVEGEAGAPLHPA